MQWKKSIHITECSKLGQHMSKARNLSYVTPNVLHSVIWMDIFFPLHTFGNGGYFIITIFDFDTSGLLPLLRNMFVTLHNGQEGQKSGGKWVQVAFTGIGSYIFLLESRWSLHFLHTFREVVLLRDIVVGKTIKILKRRAAAQKAKIAKKVHKPPLGPY